VPISTGFYTLQIEKCAESARILISTAKSARIDRLLIKIADGCDPYPTAQIPADTMTASVLKSADLELWGWAMTYGNPTDPVAQARTFAQQLTTLGLKRGIIYCADTRWSPRTARSYIDALNAAASRDTHFAVSGAVNVDFPVAEFALRCDTIMPQISLSTTESDTIEVLQALIKDYGVRFKDRELIPTLVAMGSQQTPQGKFYWVVRPDQFDNILNQCTLLKLEKVNFWHWQPIHTDRDLWNHVSNWTYQAPTTITIPDDKPEDKPAATAVGQPATSSKRSSDCPAALAVPWYSQIFPDGSGHNACGETSVKMLLGYYNKDKGDSIRALAEWLGLWGKDTGPDSLIRLAGHYGLSLTRLTPASSLNVLRDQLKQDKPIIILVNYADLGFEVHLGGGVNQGLHWLVVTGVQNDTFYINDPLWTAEMRGGKGGACLTITEAQLKKAVRSSLDNFLALA
jgi:uncharacterized protein YvpB